MKITRNNVQVEVPESVTNSPRWLQRDRLAKYATVVCPIATYHNALRSLRHSKSYSCAYKGVFWRFEP